MDNTHHTTICYYKERDGKKPAVWLILTLALLSCVFQASGQKQFNDVESLISSWNAGHNAGGASALRDVYAGTVVFDGQQVSKGSLISLKQRLFRDNRDYRQKTSSLRYQTISEALIQCNFNKEVTKDGVLWKYPAYLLIRKSDKGYIIVGESDNASSRTLDVYTGLQERIATKPLEESPRSEPKLAESKSSGDTMPVRNDSSVIAAADDSTAPTPGDVDTAVSEEENATASSSEKEINTAADRETVTLPVRYLYIGAAVFAGVFILVMIINSARRTRLRKDVKANIRNRVAHDESDREASATFEKFVMMLFDPLYFKAFRAKPVMANGAERNMDHPELEFEFAHKDTKVNFAIESIFIPELKHKDIRIASAQQLKTFRLLDEDDHDIYLVIGIAGKPDDPKEIYLIPVRDISSQYITYPELQKYRKYGMFFYNAENRTLQ